MLFTFFAEYSTVDVTEWLVMNDGYSSMTGRQESIVQTLAGGHIGKTSSITDEYNVVMSGIIIGERNIRPTEPGLCNTLLLQ